MFQLLQATEEISLPVYGIPTEKNDHMIPWSRHMHTEWKCQGFILTLNTGAKRLVKSSMHHCCRDFALELLIIRCPVRKFKKDSPREARLGAHKK